MSLWDISLFFFWTLWGELGGNLLIIPLKSWEWGSHHLKWGAPPPFFELVFTSSKSNSGDFFFEGLLPQSFFRLFKGVPISEGFYFPPKFVGVGGSIKAPQG